MPEIEDVNQHHTMSQLLIVQPVDFATIHWQGNEWKNIVEIEAKGGIDVSASTSCFEA